MEPVFVMGKKESKGNLRSTSIHPATSKSEKVDGRANNGKSRDEMVEISKHGRAATTHDGFGFLSRGWALADECCPFFAECGCEERCQAVDDLAEELESKIMSLPHVEANDLFAVKRFVKYTVWQDYIDRRLLKLNIITEKDDETKMQRIFREYFALEGVLQRLGDRLGLSPLGRKQLKAQGKLQDLASALAEVKDTRD